MPVIVDDRTGDGLVLTLPPLSVNIEQVQATSITLSWVPQGLPEEYRIVYGGTTLSGITSTTYTVENLLPNTSYTFSVYSFTSEGDWSVNSVSVGATTLIGEVDPVDIPDGGSGDVGTDKLGSFIFMTEYTIPEGSTGTCTLKYRIGNMTSGLYPEVITKTVTKESLISNFGLDPDLSGTKTYNPKEYGL
jgi:hypothetical protein